jgi:hypothetical protein
VEGEHWLMLWGIECVTKAAPKKKLSGDKSSADTNENAAYDEDADDDSGDFDGCFFVLQRCSQRAIATNNIHAACAILHFMADHLSNDLLQHLTQELESAVNGLSMHIKDVMHNILKSNASAGGADKLSGIAKRALTKGFQNVFSSRIASGSGSGGGGGGSEEKQQKDKEARGGAAEAAEAMEIFNAVELCARYTASLRKEIAASSREVFGSDVNNVTDSGTSHAVTDSLAKINMCLENFDECKECFMQAVNHAASNLAANCEVLMTEVLTKVLGEIHFDYEGDQFDAQEVVQMVPKVLVGPFEILIRLCTESLNEANKDLLVGMLVSAYASGMESFISEVLLLLFLCFFICHKFC